MSLFAALGGILAALGGAAPTGITIVDAAYVAAAGATLALAGSRGRRNSWMITALAALWLAPTAPMRIIAALAVALTGWSLATHRRRWAGALVGALLAIVLARLGDGPFHGSTAIFAGLAAVPMVLSAAVRLPEARMRVIGSLASGAAGAAALATMVFGIAGVLALGDVTTAIDHATAGFDQASDGDQLAAADSMDDSRRAFERAQSKVGGIWSAPARLVPIVSQHVRAVQVAASEGVSLTTTAAETTRAVDIDDIRVEDDAIDLELLDMLAPVLDRAENAVERASARLHDANDPWLLGPIASRLDTLTIELDDALPTARTATLAVRSLPEMLGAGGPVHWLVLTTTPAEARGLGGLVGNYLVVEANGGRVEIVAAGRNEDLNALLADVGATLDGPPGYVERWGRYTPQVLFQDITLSPDLPSVAAVAADLYEQATGLSIEGVVATDPYVMEAVLELTGPVDAGGLRLTSSNVVDFLLADQYDRFAGDDTARVLALGQLITGTFEAFTAGGLPGPRGLAREIGPLVEQDRLGFWWALGGNPTTLAADVGLDGAFPDAGTGDLLALVHQNAGQNKIDVYLERAVDYRLTIDDGHADATVTVRLTNTAPADGLPDAVIGSNDQGLARGTNLALLHLHTALDLVEVRLAGEAVPAEREFVGDHEAITLEVAVPAGRTVELTYLLAGRLPAEPYELTLPHQPLVNDDIVTATVTIDGTEHRLLTDEVLGADRVVGLASSLG